VGRYYHRDVDRVELAAIDAVDLEAVKVSRLWGWQQRTVRYPLTRCKRPYCAGAIVFGDTCLLCARTALAAAQCTEPEWAAMLAGADAQIGR
jgi:hypothetical protein